MRERGLEIEIVLQVRAHPIGAHRSLRQRGELVRELLGGGARLAARHDAVDEPHRERLVGASTGAAGEDQIERARQADQARQADRAAVDQRHAEAAAEHAEHRVLLGDAQVAPQRELEPAGDRVARDRGDHRLAEQHPRRAHRAVAVGRDAVGRAGGDRLEIGARAERAVIAVQHARPARRRRRRTRGTRRRAPRAVSRSTAFFAAGRSRITVVTGPDAFDSDHRRDCSITPWPA